MDGFAQAVVTNDELRSARSFVPTARTLEALNGQPSEAEKQKRAEHLKQMREQIRKKKALQLDADLAEHQFSRWHFHED